MKGWWMTGFFSKEDDGINRLAADTSFPIKSTKMKLRFLCSHFPFRDGSFLGEPRKGFFPHSGSR